MITALWDIDGTLVQNPKGRTDLFTEAIEALGASEQVAQWRKETR